MASYNFKSVGVVESSLATTGFIGTKSIPFGIATPLQIGTTEGILVMNYSLATQFADNLRNLLLTNWGERLGQYNFGANLKPLTTELSSMVDFDNQAIQRIRDAVNTWMPFIDLENFDSLIDRNENKNTAVIKINITYNIAALGVNGKGLQIVLYVI
jgi:phage baseplate assembly protein W